MQIFVQTAPLQASCGVVQTIDAPALAGRARQLLQNGRFWGWERRGTGGSRGDPPGSAGREPGGAVCGGERAFGKLQLLLLFLHPGRRKLHARPPFLILLAIAPVADWPLRLQLLQLPSPSLECLLLSSPALLSEVSCTSTRFLLSLHCLLLVESTTFGVM